MAQTKASSIGWMFVPQYYTFVNKDPARLHCFYTKRSTLIHGVEGEDCAPCHGQQEIHEKIMSLDYDDCKVFVSTVDSQSSAESGIIVQVVGELSNKGGAWRKFAQTFFLAEQPNGYFVLNDIFRYIKEDSDEEEGAAQQQQQQQQDASSTAVGAASQSQSVPQQSFNEQAGTAAAEHHDLQLSNAHGPSGSAPALTMAPPTEAAQSETLANLEGLANGNQEQQQVVELHDEIDVAGQTEAAVPAQAAQAEEESVPQVNGVHAEQEQKAEESAAPAAPAQETVPEPIARPSPPAAEPSHPEASTSNSAQDLSAGSSAAAAKAPSASSSRPSKPAQQQQQAAPQKQQEPAAPVAPAGPKTWASLAATGSGKWKQQVVSNTQGVSSSGPTTSAPASSGQSQASSGQQASEAGPSSSSNNNNNSGRPETRNIVNYETGHSVIVRNVGQPITYAILRRKVSEKFARGMGGDRQYARLAYIDIDRSKQIAHVDFEEEWPLNKFGSSGDSIGVEIDGITMQVEKGRLERRPLAEVNARANAGAGAGGPNRSNNNNNAQRQQGQGQGPRTAGQQGNNAGRGQPPRDGQQGQSAAARKATPGRIGGAPRM